MDITLDDVGALAAGLGGFLPDWARYVPAVVAQDDAAGLEAGGVGQPHGTLIVVEGGPADGLQTLTDALAALRAGTLKAAAPVPVSVWDWQFAGEAAAEGIITAQEALDWVGGGHVPASLVTAVDAAVTDPVQHAKVVLFLTGASQFPRAHPLVPVLGAAFGKDTPEKLDAFFVAAGDR